MKIRLAKGPFGGQVKTVSADFGRYEIVMRGPKKMTHEERWELHRNNDLLAFPQNPQVEARYCLAMRTINGAHVPCIHPDGSLFYEYVEGSKREF